VKILRHGHDARRGLCAARKQSKASNYLCGLLAIGEKSLTSLTEGLAEEMVRSGEKRGVRG